MSTPSSTTPRGPRAEEQPGPRASRRVERAAEARGERELLRRVTTLADTVVAGRFRLGRVIALGGEGAVLAATDLRRSRALVAKLAVQPWHRPIQLSSAQLRRGRDRLLVEAERLRACAGPLVVRCVAAARFENPLLEAARGGEFARPEPVLFLERLPGRDADRWLARVHRSVQRDARLRRTLDRLVLDVLAALAHVESRGHVVADLRPGNLRILGRPRRTLRLLDGGSLRPLDDDSDFPHVPSYLPPDTFRRTAAGELLVPSRAHHAAMAGRTLYELATGASPEAGRHVDPARLLGAPVSPRVAETIAALCAGTIDTVGGAFRSIAKHG